jgi:poly(3-hydroxybutyrate) depolymerase
LLYHLYEFGHAAMGPSRAAADTCKYLLRNPFNPLSRTTAARGTAAALEVLERITRRYAKPEFGIAETLVGGTKASVAIETVWERPFCRLLHFKKQASTTPLGQQPRLLIVAPMSGHYATLLRGTVEGMLPTHDVYITDWIDARIVPLSRGRFDLNDYIDYVIELCRLFEGDVHVMAVCQPSVPVLAAVSYMEAMGDPHAPHSMVLMGGPIDTRINPTAVNALAEKRGLNWFRRSVITTVPWPNPGMGRRVYPGFLQLTGFMSMNLERHLNAHKELFFNLVQGDGDSVEKHKAFYDEYLSVMDLTAEFYLQTVDEVFIRHLLPRGEFEHRGVRIDPAAIRRAALLTIEGEKDDITGLGQCKAAHDLCVNIPDKRRMHHVQPGVGHYGIFNGARFQNEIAPLIGRFIARHDPASSSRHRLSKVLQAFGLASLFAPGRRPAHP